MGEGNMGSDMEALSQIKGVIRKTGHNSEFHVKSVEEVLSCGDKEYHEAILAVRRAGFWLTILVDLWYSATLILAVGSVLWARMQTKIHISNMIVSLLFYLALLSFFWWVSRKIAILVRDLKAKPFIILIIMGLAFIGYLPLFFLVMPSFYLYYTIKAFSKWGNYNKWFKEMRQSRKIKSVGKEKLKTEIVCEKQYKIAQVIFVAIIALWSAFFGVFFGQEISMVGEQEAIVPIKKEEAWREYMKGYTKGYIEAVKCHDKIVEEFNSTGRQTTRIMDCRNNY